MKDWQQQLENVGILINDNQVEKFERYFKLLLEWNKRTSLISRADESHLMDRHVFESLSVLLAFKIQPNLHILDIGSGAGFPAVAISLARPDLNFLLVESKRIKVLFLKEVVCQLELNKVNVIADRAEKLSKNESYIKQFDFAFSRAVASLEVVYEWIHNLIKLEGAFIAWKGGNVQQEIASVKNKFKNIAVAVINMDKRLVSEQREKRFVRIQTIV